MKTTHRLGAVLLIIGVGVVLSDGTLAAQGQKGGQGSAGGAAAQMPAGIHVMKGAGEAGVLADANGMTLYTYTKDPSDASHCYAPCLGNRTPLVAAADAQPIPNWTIHKRQDGIRQWVYKGRPLYVSTKEQKPGDTVGTSGTGAGDDAWKIAVP